MSDNQDYKVNGIPTEEPEIFGRSKSIEQIKAEKAADKKKQKEAEKAQRAARREAAKAQPKSTRKDIISVVCVLLALLLVCGGMLFWQFYKEAEREKFEQDETMSYFLDSEAKPELSADGIKAAVTSAYYTKGGHLCVEMLLSNGMATDQHLISIQVEISNTQTEALIAGGYTDGVADTYVVPAGGYNEYVLYISPEHVKIHDDSLAEITYSITTDAVEVKE